MRRRKLKVRNSREFASSKKISSLTQVRQHRQRTRLVRTVKQRALSVARKILSSRKSESAMPHLRAEASGNCDRSHPRESPNMSKSRTSISQTSQSLSINSKTFDLQRPNSRRDTQSLPSTQSPNLQEKKKKKRKSLQSRITDHTHANNLALLDKKQEEKKSFHHPTP